MSIISAAISSDRKKHHGVLPAPPADVVEIRKDVAMTCPLLRGLMKFEGVWDIDGHADLKRRIGNRHPWRTIIAKRDPYDFDPATPNKMTRALASVQVALTEGVAGEIHPILAGTDVVTTTPDTAMYYSISSWVGGGGYGRGLIRDSVSLLHGRYPEIKTFSTLSPIQSLRTWVAQLNADKVAEMGAFDVLTVTPNRFEDFRVAAVEATSPAQLQARDMLGDLQRLAAFCITGGQQEAKGFMSHDRTAGFHLGNGAEAWRVCPQPVTSARRFTESWDLMVNYLYPVDFEGENPLHQLEVNKQAAKNGKPARSAAIESLMRRSDGLVLAPVG